MNSNEINKFIKENTEKIYDEMVKIRRKIHMNYKYRNCGDNL